MIKKGVMFLLLLGLGFLGLHLAIGDENFANVSQKTVGDEERPEPPRGAVPLRDEGSDSQYLVSARGALAFNRTKPVAWDGKQINLLVYALECLDSEPLADNLQRLDEVRVRIYEHREQNGEPIDVHTMDLTAVQAVVQLERNERGQTTIRQDKEMELSQAVWRANENSRMPGTELSVERVRVRLVDGEVELHTPTDQELVILDVTGPRPARLTGLGLQARMPGRDGEGAQRIDLAINRQPVMIADGGRTRLSSQGQLKYIETIADGSVLVTMEHDVSLKASGDFAATDASPVQLGNSVEVKGDRLSAWLRRSRRTGSDGRERNELTWRFIKLDGAPATLSGEGFNLRSSALNVVPSQTGDPLIISASGADTRMVVTDPKTGAETTFTAARTIRLVRPGARLLPVYRSFGFPAWTLDPLRRLEIVIFEGQTQVSGGSELTLSAEKGLWLIRTTEDADAVTMRGFGEVTVERPDPDGALVAHGNRGFTLTRSPRGETLVLGPAKLDPEMESTHRYDIRRGEIVLEGSGRCSFERHEDGSVDVVLRSTEPTISGQFGDDLGSLTAATDVTATMVQKDLTAFDARGPRVQLNWQRGGEEIVATGNRIEQTEPDTFRLTGTVAEPAVVRRKAMSAETKEDTVLSCPVVNVYRVGEESVVLDAHHPSLAKLQVSQPPTEGRPGIAADLEAVDLRILPFAVPSSILDLHAASLPPGVRGLFGLGLRGPVLLADFEVRIEQNGDDGQRTEATGQSLVLSLTAEAGLLTGLPGTRGPGLLASLHRREADGRELHAEAPAIRLRRVAGGEEFLLAAAYPDTEKLVEPQLRLHNGAAGDRGFGSSDFAARCGGPILVLPGAVDFQGPIHLQSVLANGDVDPVGLDLAARGVAMERDPKSGEVRRIVATGDVELEWSRIRARAHELILDLQRTLCTVVAEPGGVAEVTLPGHGSVSVVHAQANYTTMRISTWNGRAVGRSTRPVNARAQ